MHRQELSLEHHPRAGEGLQPLRAQGGGERPGRRAGGPGQGQSLPIGVIGEGPGASTSPGHRARRQCPAQMERHHEQGHHEGRGRDLLQGLGQGAAHRLQPWLAALGGRLGQPDAVLPGTRAIGSSPTTAAVTDGRRRWRRARHGPLRRRPGGGDRASGSEGRHPRRPLHRRRRSGALPRASRHEPRREGGAHQRGAAADGQDAGESRRAPEVGLRRPPGSARHEPLAVLPRPPRGTVLRLQPPGRESRRRPSSRTGGARG